MSNENKNITVEANLSAHQRNKSTLAWKNAC
jgi:hypothetical protein